MLAEDILKVQPEIKTDLPNCLLTDYVIDALDISQNNIVRFQLLKNFPQGFCILSARLILGGLVFFKLYLIGTGSLPGSCH